MNYHLTRPEIHQLLEAWITIIVAEETKRPARYNLTTAQIARLMDAVAPPLLGGTIGKEHAQAVINILLDGLDYGQ